MFPTYISNVLQRTYMYTSVCVSVCVYPINVKTAEPNSPKICVGPHVTPGKVYEVTKFQKFVF